MCNTYCLYSKAFNWDAAQTTASEMIIGLNQHPSDTLLTKTDYWKFSKCRIYSRSVGLTCYVGVHNTFVKTKHVWFMNVFLCVVLSLLDKTWQTLPQLTQCVKNFHLCIFYFYFISTASVMTNLLWHASVSLHNDRLLSLFLRASWCGHVLPVSFFTVINECACCCCLVALNLLSCNCGFDFVLKISLKQQTELSVCMYTM